MKAKHRENDYILKEKDWYRQFDLNWDNINSFDDFKKAKLLELSLSDEVFGSGCACVLEFPKWVSRNPDFEKYFMMIC